MGAAVQRWEGARQPAVWSVPPPEGDPAACRLALARRYLHVYGPSTAASFATWSGITPAACAAVFDALAPSLLPVVTPLGDAWLLAGAAHQVTVRPWRELTTAERDAVAAEAQTLPPPGLQQAVTLRWDG